MPEPTPTPMPTPPATPAGDPAQQPTGDQPPPAPDLTGLTVDALRGHPSFQTEINRVVQERLTREQQKWQERLDREKQIAGLDDAEKMKAAIEDEKKRTEEARKATSEAHQLVAKTKAEVLAIAEGARADRAAAVVAHADLTGSVDDTGQVAEGVIRAAVVKALSEFPEWKTEGQPDPQAAAQQQQSRSGGDLNPSPPTGRTFTQSQIEAMSTEERVKQWPEIEKAMEEGRLVYGR